MGTKLIKVYLVVLTRLSTKPLAPEAGGKLISLNEVMGTRVMALMEALKWAAQGKFNQLAPFKGRPCVITLLDAIPEIISPTQYAHLLPDPLLYEPWYLERALEMERQTGSVKTALELLELAASQHTSQIEALRDLLLIYDALLNWLPPDEAVRLTFAEFQAFWLDGQIPSRWTLDLCKQLLLNDRIHLSSIATKSLFR